MFGYIFTLIQCCWLHINQCLKVNRVFTGLCILLCNLSMKLTRDFVALNGLTMCKMCNWLWEYIRMWAIYICLYLMLNLMQCYKIYFHPELQ